MSPSFDMSPPSLRGERAFSLVEVTLALGLAAFVLIALVGLIPMGIQSSNDSVEESRALNVLGAIVTDRTASPQDAASLRYKLPKLIGQTGVQTGYFGVSENFVSTDSDLNEARYRVDYRITAPPAGQDGPFFISLRASWPPKAVKPVNLVEIVSTVSPQ